MRAMTAVDIASSCGVSERSVRAWLTGTVPTRANMVTLAGVLGVTVDWLENGVVGGAASPVSARGVDVARMFDLLDRGDQDAIAAVIDSLTQKTRQKLGG